MANYSAADIKKLREATGAGMLDCKKALEESQGDYDKAVEFLRVKGLKGVAKREGRTTSNGLVISSIGDGVGTLLELNCETDFVAKGEKFQELADNVLAAAVDAKATDVDSTLAAPANGSTVQALIDEANAVIGEKIVVRRVCRIEAACVVSYLHKTNPDLPAQVGVLLGLTGDAGDVGRDVAMHIAAMQPVYVNRDAVPADIVENERRVAEETAKEEGKPEQALPKIVEGRVNGFFKEKVLVDQPFAKENKKTVAQILSDAGVEPTEFARYRVGLDS